MFDMVSDDGSKYFAHHGFEYCSYYFFFFVFRRTRVAHRCKSVRNQQRKLKSSINEYYMIIIVGLYDHILLSIGSASDSGDTQ